MVFKFQVDVKGQGKPRLLSCPPLLSLLFSMAARFAVDLLHLEQSKKLNVSGGRRSSSLRLGHSGKEQFLLRTYTLQSCVGSAAKGSLSSLSEVSGNSLRLAAEPRGF